MARPNLCFSGIDPRAQWGNLQEEDNPMAKPAKTVVEVVELGGGKVMLLEVLTKEQLAWMGEVFEPYSRRYRGQYQSLAKAIVAACNERLGMTP